MKKIFTLLFTLFLLNNLTAQVTENFDGDFCSGRTGCWEKDQFGSVAARTSNQDAKPICIAATKNTTTPITGTGSLNSEYHFDSQGGGLALSYFYDTIYSVANGVNGNTVSFNIRFNELAYNTGEIFFSVKVMCGTFIAEHVYTPADEGTVFNINETITGAGAGGTIMIVLSNNASTSSDFDLNYDLDDFTTTAALDLNNTCIQLSSPLPVKLLSFNGKSENCKSILNWKTSSEINVSHFEIQQSNNGINFTSIGSLSAKNNSTGDSYQFIDNNANENFYYYRLLTVDIDGKKEYFKVIKVNGCKTNAIEIFPNPTENSINISGIKNNSLIEVKNYLGQVVLTKTASQNNETINVQHLPKNIYFISIVNKETSERKVIKVIKN